MQGIDLLSMHFLVQHRWPTTGSEWSVAQHTKSIVYDRLHLNCVMVNPCCLCQGSTFGIPGVHEHAHFLRNIRDAEEIRSKVIQNVSMLCHAQ